MAEHAPTADGGLAVVPLAPDRWDDLVGLFRTGSETRWCWCMYFRRPAREFSAANAAENRTALQGLASATPPAGYVAYLDGDPVGWVSAGPVEGYARIGASRFYPRTDERPGWAVVCFFVTPRRRRSGVAGALLDAAIEAARAAGAPAIEAYPIESAAPRSASALYRGTLGMYRAAGFEEVGRVPVPPGAVRVIVRRELP